MYNIALFSLIPFVVFLSGNISGLDKVQSLGV